MNAVKVLCDSAILLENGNVVEQGEPETIINTYNFLIAKRSKGQKIRYQTNNKTTFGYGNYKVMIDSVALLDENNNQSEILISGRPVKFVTRLIGQETVDNITIKKRWGLMYKKIYVAALVVIFLGFVSTLSAKSAKDRWWKDQDLVQKVKITEVQQDKIDKILGKSRSDLKKLKTKARELKTQLNSIFGKADLDQEKFSETLMKFADIRKQQYIEMVQVTLKVREVFVKDQIKILLTEHTSVRRSMT